MENNLENVNRREFLKKVGKGALGTAAVLGSGVLLVEKISEMHKIEKEHTFIGEGQILSKRESVPGDTINPNINKLPPFQKFGDGVLDIKVGEGHAIFHVPKDVYDKYEVGESLRIKYTDMPEGNAPKFGQYKIFSIEE